MRYGIVSDIHANWEALKVLARFLDKQKIDMCLCLGDIVGYGGSPEECLRWVYHNCSYVVQSNHDLAASGVLDIRYFGIYASLAIKTTRNLLNTREKSCKSC